MGRKRLAQGRRRVLTMRVEEGLAERAEEAAGDEGLSVWLRGLVAAALGDADEMPKVSPPETVREVDPPVQDAPEDLDLPNLGAGDAEEPATEEPVAGAEDDDSALTESESSFKEPDYGDEPDPE